MSDFELERGPGGSGARARGRPLACRDALSLALAWISVRRRLVGIVLGVVGAVGGAGLAMAEFSEPYVVADATKPGHIDFYLAGEPGTRMTVSEFVEGEETRYLGSTILDGAGHGVIRDGSRWRCDRLSRRFEVKGRIAGKPVRNTYGVRTGSCRDRLDVGLARRARPGSRIRLVIRDQWGVGELRLRLCKTEKGDRPRCRIVWMPKNRPRYVTALRVYREGHAKIQVSGTGIRLSRIVAVGPRTRVPDPPSTGPRILAAGDSMMQGVDAFLADRLGSRARVFRDVNPNSGISKPGLDWAQHARDHTRKVRPAATIVFLGANEGFALPTASGALVDCCGPVWYAEFASRVRSMMLTYGRAGKADVLWIINPAPRSEERQVLQRVVNAAVVKAAEGLPRVRIVRFDEVFTPGGVYRDVMTYRGRRVRVRESDGIHLSLPGARIAAEKLTAELRAARVIR